MHEPEAEVAEGEEGQAGGEDEVAGNPVGDRTQRVGGDGVDGVVEDVGADHPGEGEPELAGPQQR